MVTSFLRLMIEPGLPLDLDAEMGFYTMKEILKIKIVV
jgi:hypothetical protein